MKRLPQLDGIRGLAIIMVVFCHLIIAIWSEGRGDFGDAVEWSLGSGVDLFFVLSGFLISGILLDARGKPGVIKAFYMRRILRIVPLYYAVLIFYGGLLALLFPEGNGFGGEWLTHPVGHFLFFSNFQFFLEGQLPKTPLAASWSLAVEEHYYLVWPMIVLWLTSRKYISVCVAVIIATVVVRYVLILNGANDNQILIFTFSRMDSFAFGGLLALAWRNNPGRDRLTTYFPWGIIIGLGLPAVAYPLIKTVPEVKNLLQPWMYSLANIGFASLIGFVLNRPHWLRGLFQSRWLCSFGQYSYGIYLTNLGVIYGLILLFGAPVDWLGGIGTILFIPLALGAVWTTGKILHLTIERPFLRMKSRYPMDSNLKTSLKR